MISEVSGSINRDRLVGIAAVVTLLGFGAVSVFAVKWLWGLNHLAYLDPAWNAVLFAGLWIALYAVLRPGRHGFGDRITGATARFLWDRGWWPRLLIVLAFGTLFLYIHPNVLLIGDGYHSLMSGFQSAIFRGAATYCGRFFCSSLLSLCTSKRHSLPLPCWSCS